MTDELVIDRRRAVALAAALALGAATDLAQLSESVAAKKKGKRKSKKSKKGKASSGKEIVEYAEKFKGSKYKWGGASPKGFDCSGFTWYVYEHAAGIDIGRVVKDQYKKGESVSKGSWKAGDIVFFKNTAEKGLSHNGIYMSGSKFIHAENEKAGVVISSLDSDYYRGHYAGARRIL